MIPFSCLVGLSPFRSYGFLHGINNPSRWFFFHASMILIVFGIAKPKGWMHDSYPNGIVLFFCMSLERNAVGRVLNYTCAMKQDIIEMSRTWKVTRDDRNNHPARADRMWHLERYKVAMVLSPSCTPLACLVPSSIVRGREGRGTFTYLSPFLRLRFNRGPVGVTCSGDLRWILLSLHLPNGTRGTPLGLINTLPAHCPCTACAVVHRFPRTR
ncbi:MAG: hypothetical protein J3Q66DRAFT_346308 [Benniella sp.]|nr:MAG: hypothetical protein J3Q66DRAFT_346308 [Benniella sp.]